MGQFATAMKDPKFKELFMDYIKEISNCDEKEAMERHIKQCERGQNSPNGGFCMEGKILLLPLKDFCVKTHNLKTKQKVFINICYCEKIKNSKAYDDSIQKGTHWEIPYSLGGPSLDIDKVGKECIVFDFIVGVKTHENAKDHKPFKQFLILTAIEAIEKQKSIELSKDFALPLMSYKGKNGAKEPRVFTIPKEPKNTGSNAQGKADDDASLTPQMALETKDGKNPKRPSPIELGCDGNVRRRADKGGALPSCGHAAGETGSAMESRALAEWRSETEPMFEVLHRSTVDYSHYWEDTKLNNENSSPTWIVLRVHLKDVTSVHDVQLDLEKDQVFLRVPGKYRLKVDLKYKVDNFQSNAKWDKKKQQLLVTLPIKVDNSEK